MTVKHVDFGAFADKHISIADSGTSSSDITTESVRRLSGRAAIRLGQKGKKLSGKFHGDVVKDNRAEFRSGTTINSVIVVTPASLAVWHDDILDKAKKAGSGEFHCETELKAAAAISMALGNKKDYGSDLALNGGYGVKVDVLVKIHGDTAAVVHLHKVETFTHTIPSGSIADQSALFSNTFLNGLADL